MTLAPARRFPLVILAYLGPLAVIPLVLSRGGRGDGEVSWHAWQGLLFSAMVLTIVGALTAMTGLTALTGLPAGIALGIVTWLVWAAGLAVQLTALVAALAGSRVTVPFVGALASRLSRRQT